MTLNIDFSKGLVPAILQHYQTKQVLMLGYMNKAAYEQTVKTGEVCFYSRSKQRLWVKGETSGHKQRVMNIHIDCDQDTILIEVNPLGPTCHTGEQSCFNIGQPFCVQQLAQNIVDSAQSKREQSYTKYLLDQGIEKITKKFGEEAFEVVIAAIKADRQEVINESADVLYHLFVLLHALDIDFTEIEAELEHRYRKQNNFKGERRPIEQW